MDAHAKRILLDIINERDPEIRKRKVSNEEALDEIIDLLKSGQPWRYLRPKCGCSYSCIYKRFANWTNASVFESGWKTLLEMYSTQQLEKNVNWFKDIYIDSTMVKNICGRDFLGPNPTDRGRLGSKISSICDNNQVPLSCTFYGANVGDSTTTMESFESIPTECRLRIDRRTTINLIGDKGYISSADKNRLRRSRVNLTTPYKKDSRESRIPHSMSDKTKLKLKNRHHIENIFCRMDKFKRIIIRQEQLMLYYSGWNFLACALVTAAHLDG
jgi:transposase